MDRKEILKLSPQMDWVNLSYVETDELEGWQIDWISKNGCSIAMINKELLYYSNSSNYHSGIDKWMHLLETRLSELKGK